MFVKTAVASIVCFGIMTGCDAIRSPSAGTGMQHTIPEEFFTDPLQRQLAIAVDKGDAQAVDAAVKAGAQVNSWGKAGFSLLYWAMARKSVAGFEALLKNGADATVDYRNPSRLPDDFPRESVIRLAVQAEDPGFLRAALRQGFDPDYILDKNGKETLLFVAGAAHSQQAMQLLLDAGANIEHQDLMGFTALGDAMLRRDFETMWFLLQRGADPMTGSTRGSDVPSKFKMYGSRGVRPDQRDYFEKVVDDLVKRGLLTRQDIIEADKPKTSNPPGVTVIEHDPNSEAGQAILELDRAEREANRRDGR